MKARAKKRIWRLQEMRAVKQNDAKVFKHTLRSLDERWEANGSSCGLLNRQMTKSESHSKKISQAVGC